MANNTTLNTMSGGDVIADEDIGGVKHQLVKVEFGAAGSATPASSTNPLPVQSGSSTITGNGPQTVTAAVTDTLILAANVNRRGVAIFNDSTAILSLSIGTNAASASNRSVPIQPSGYYEMPFGYTGQIRGVWSAVNGAAKVTEFV